MATHTRFVVAFLSAGALLCLGASSASAAVTCSFAGTTLTITLAANNDAGTVVRHATGTNIDVVSGASTPVACAGAQATVTNTDLIVADDTSGFRTIFNVDLSNGAFSPGATNETGSSDEIEIQANMDTSQDNVGVVDVSANNDTWRMGKTAVGNGVNLNAASEPPAAVGLDYDLELIDTEIFDARSGQGNDKLLANGGSEFTGPMTVNASLTAGDGDDQLIGGDGDDELLDGPGDDTANGGAGDDELEQSFGAAGTGDDDFDGGPGADQVTYAPIDPSLGPVRADLRLGGRQQTGGGGADSFTGVEGVYGTQFNDVLIGDDGSNRLSGWDGDDLLTGLGGPDVLSGGTQNDTVSYATPPAGGGQGVTVDLGIQPPSEITVPTQSQDTVGAGLDTLGGVENVIGSPFADTLRGNDVDNRLEIRDGTGDSATCGGGADTVIADVAGTDSVAGDCETVDSDMRPDTAIASGPNSLSRDATPTVAFTTDKAGSTFECSLDNAAFSACPSQLTLAKVSDGAHDLRVRARDMLGALDLSPATATFSVDTTSPRITKAKVAGRSFRYRLSEGAKLTVKVQRCAKRKGRKGCKRYKTVTTFSHDEKKGSDKNVFPRRMRGKKARPGLYRATLTAKDAAGNHSKPKRLGFAIR